MIDCTDFKNMNERHIFSSEEKLNWFGYGEWVEEPDLVNFNHKGFDCRVVRIAIREHDESFHICGGYLNGYVRIPSDHPYYQKIYEDMEIDCHGGLTFGEYSDGHWIGFDCAHSFDFIPSLEKFYREHPSCIEETERMEELKEKLNIKNSPIFQKTYRSVAYCVDQCKSIVDQLIEVAKNVKSSSAS